MGAWRLTWRKSFMLLMGFSLTALVLSGVFVWQTTTRHYRLTGEFLSLFDRCRLAVELRQDLDRAGLVAIEALGNPHIDDRSADLELLAPPNSRFAIALETRTSGAAANVKCQVFVADWRAPLDGDELAALTYAFIQLRKERVAAGTHEMREFGPLPPVTSVVFIMKGRNSAGCEAISNMLLDSEQHYFSASVGERVVDCDPALAEIDEA